MENLIDPYEGLSEAARKLCVERMRRTLLRKGRGKKAIAYMKSLSGEAVLPVFVPDKASTAVIRRVRKQRISPFAAKSEKRHHMKRCRRASRFQPGVARSKSYPSRDMQVMREFRRILHRAQGGLCAICGEALHTDPYRCSLDHVIPRALNGAEGLGNYVVTHGECNGDKSNDIPTGCEMVFLLAVNARLGVKPDTF